MPILTIKVPEFNTDNLRKRLIKALDRRGRSNENILLRTTQYFETVRPTFKSEVEKVNGDWQVITAPLDDESGEIWTYLDQGTDVRYAWMNENFAAGTTPGTFVTTPTVGDKVGLSVEVPADPEGIEPRGWTDLLAKQEQPVFQGEVKDAIGKWLKNFSSGASKIISGG